MARPSITDPAATTLLVSKLIPYSPYQIVKYVAENLEDIKDAGENVQDVLAAAAQVDASRTEILGIQTTLEGVQADIVERQAQIEETFNESMQEIETVRDDVNQTYGETVAARDVTTAARDLTLTYRNTTQGLADATNSLKLQVDATALAVEASRIQTQQAALTAQMYYPGARSFVPQGLTLGAATISNAGSGGTNGTFALGWTGGNFAVNPTGTFTVSGGVVTAINITGPGLYLGAAINAPAMSFAASTGLTGAAGSVATRYLKAAGEYYLTDHATDPNMASLFQNQGNAAVQITASVGWLNISAAISAGATAAAAGVIIEKALSVNARNIFNMNAEDAVTGAIINANTGAQVNSAGYNASGYIPVVGGKTLVASKPIGFTGNALYGVAFYDGNKTYVSGINGVIAAGTTMAIPSNAVWMRFSTQNTNNWKKMHLSYGTVIPTYYRQFELLDGESGSRQIGVRAYEELNDRNLYEVANAYAGYVAATTGVRTASTAYATTGKIRVDAGVQYFVKYVANNATAGVAYFDSDGLYLSGAGNLATNLFTPPDGAWYMEVSFDSRASTSLGKNAKTQEVYRVLSARPAVYKERTFVDSFNDWTNAIKAARSLERTNRDYFNIEECVFGGVYSSTDGSFTANASFAQTNKIPVFPGSVRVPTFGTSGSLYTSWYDRNGNWIYSSGGLGSGILTNNSNQINITATTVANNLDSLRLPKGSPITGTGIPTNTYIIDGPEQGPGIYTMSQNATAGDGVAVSSWTSQGHYANIPIITPRDAHFVSFTMASGQHYWGQVLNKVWEPGDVFMGFRQQFFGDTPYAGHLAILGGDSIMQSSAAGTGQPVNIPPGMPQSAGITQYTIQINTQMDVVQARGSSGYKLHEMLDIVGTYPALTQDYIDERTMTATTTLDSAQIAVPSGVLVPYRRVKGPGIPAGAYVVSNDGSGNYTLSKKCTASATITLTCPAVRIWADEGGGNSWGILGSGAGQRSVANTVLGNIDDQWIPTVFAATVTAGQTSLSVGAISRGQLQHGAPVLHPSVTPFLQVGTTLVLTGGVWSLSLPALESGNFTARSGTFYGDMYDIYIRKLLTWNPKMRLHLFGLLRRFDGTAALSNRGGVDYRDGDPVNLQGVYYSQFNDAKKAFAERYGLIFHDTWRELHINSYTQADIIGDLVHPTTRGVVENYGQYLSKKLNQSYRIGQFNQIGI